MPTKKQIYVERVKVRNARESFASMAYQEIAALRNLPAAGVGILTVPAHHDDASYFTVEYRGVRLSVMVSSVGA